MTPKQPIDTEKQRDLKFAYPLYKEMYDNDVVFCFQGIINSDLVTYILEILEDILDEELYDKRVIRKVSNVMVESLTNRYLEPEADNLAETFTPASIIVVRKLQDNTFLISTGTYIPSDRIKSLKRLLTRVNSLPYEELKEEYKELLMKPGASEELLTALGIIDLARKSKNELIYEFNFVTPQISFFTLETRISKRYL
jgi:hypothetical protein